MLSTAFPFDLSAVLEGMQDAMTIDVQLHIEDMLRDAGDQRAARVVDGLYDILDSPSPPPAPASSPAQEDEIITIPDEDDEDIEIIIIADDSDSDSDEDELPSLATIMASKRQSSIKFPSAVKRRCL
jgi:hypothetical protein